MCRVSQAGLTTTEVESKGLSAFVREKAAKTGITAIVKKNPTIPDPTTAKPKLFKTFVTIVLIVVSRTSYGLE